MKIEILGPGCPKCATLAERAEAAAKNLGVAYELHKVRDVGEIMKRGVVFTPALAVDGAVKISGKVPDEAEIMTILTSAME